MSCVEVLCDVRRSRRDRVFSRVRSRCPRCGRYSARIHSRIWFGLKASLAAAALAGLVYAGMNVDLRGMLSRTPARPQDGTNLARDLFAEQIAAADEMRNGKPRPSLNNDEVIRLWSMRVSTSLILHLIQTSKPDFDFSADGLVQMRDAQLDPAIVEAMDKANSAGPHAEP